MDHDKHVRQATQELINAMNAYYDNNEAELKDEFRPSDFSVTVAANLVALILTAGKRIFGHDLTDEVCANIREDVTEWSKEPLPGHDVETH